MSWMMLGFLLNAATPGAEPTASVALGTAPVAQVEVDGKLYRQTPWLPSNAPTLAPGRHVFRFRTRNGDRFDYSVELKPGANKVIIPMLGGPSRTGNAVLLAKEPRNRQSSPPQPAQAGPDDDDAMDDDGDEAQWRAALRVPQSENAEELLDYARRCMWAGRLDDAEQAAARAVRLNPDSAPALRVLLAVNLRQQNACEARLHAETLVRRFPSEPATPRVQAILKEVAAQCGAQGSSRPPTP